MNYAIVPAANVSQFLANDKAVEELNNLFAWAAKSNNGTIIFFDEAETFLADRSTLGLAAQNALSAFLAKTGTPSNKIMIICATNRPEIVDDAALSRLGLKVKFELPDQATREKILTMHIEKTFKKKQGKVVDYTLLQQQSTVANIANCSGRTLQKGVNRWRQMALSQDKPRIDQNIIDAVVHQIKNDKRFK